MAFANYSVSTSGEKSSTDQITTISSYLHGLELNPPASGLATLKIYDSNASGTSKLITTATSVAGLNSVHIEFPHPRACNSGIYVVLTGTTTYNIGFSLG